MIDSILALVMLLVGTAAILAMIRAMRGPQALDRVLAVNVIGTLAVLAICLYGFISGRPIFLDIALLYALINFIGVIAILKFFRVGTLGDHAPKGEED